MYPSIDVVARRISFGRGPLVGDRAPRQVSSERVLQLPINACAALVLVANTDLTVGSVLYSAFYSAFYFFFRDSGCVGD